jgi:SEC-C motif
MTGKLGRNDPCWCKSGKKYKKCHLDRDKMPTPSRQEVFSAVNATRNKKYCLHPAAGADTCKGDIVKAHTIQRNGGLSKIAEAGHVMHFHLDFSKPPGNPTWLTTERIGLNKASTFTGFCNLHDTKTFEPIERHPFVPNPKSTFLLGYRALSREIFAKRAQNENVPLLKGLDKGKSLDGQIMLQAFMGVYGEGVAAGLKDAEHHKNIYDRILASNDFSESRFYVLCLDRTPDIMCSAVKLASHDFRGNVVQDLSRLDSLMESITFSLIATDNGGAAVFSWAGASEPCERIVRSLDSYTDEEVPHALVRLIFEFFENAYFSQSWWNNLDEGVKKSLQMRFSMGVDPTALRQDNCLVDDGVRAVSWKVTSRHTNVN